jgi:hypothetical protein
MARRPDSGPIYIFDSAAWIECNERAGDNRIPILLDTLHKQRRICSPKQVFKELERPGEISKWVQDRRSELVAFRGLPAEIARKVGEVQHRFPGMGKAMGPKERADPFVVGLSLTMTSDRQPWIVITSESRRKRPNRKIPGVCDVLGLKCITLNELIELELGNEEAGEGSAGRTPWIKQPLG